MFWNAAGQSGSRRKEKKRRLVKKKGRGEEKKKKKKKERRQTRSQSWRTHTYVHTFSIAESFKEEGGEKIEGKGR